MFSAAAGHCVLKQTHNTTVIPQCHIFRRGLGSWFCSDGLQVLLNIESVWQEVRSSSVLISVCVCVGGDLCLMVLVPRGRQSGVRRITLAAAQCPLRGNGHCQPIRAKCFHSRPQIVIWPGYWSSRDRQSTENHSSAAQNRTRTRSSLDQGWLWHRSRQVKKWFRLGVCVF